MNMTSGPCQWMAFVWIYIGFFIFFYIVIWKKAGVLILNLLCTIVIKGSTDISKYILGTKLLHLKIHLDI